MTRSGTPATSERQTASFDCSHFRQPTRVAILTAVLAALTAGPAVAQPIVLYNGPFNAVQENPCLAGEFVELTGRMVVTDYTRVDGAGGVHHTFRVITKAKGTVVASLFAPQKDYVLNDENVSEFNAPSSGTFESTLVLNHVMIRKSETEGTADDLLLGSGEDFMLKDTVHFTVVNGVPTATVTKGHSRCM